MNGYFDWAEALRTSPILISLVGCSVVSLGAAIDRVLHYRRLRGNPDMLLAQVTDRVRGGQLDRAFDLCKACHHPIGPVAIRLLEGLRDAKGSSDEYLQIALSEQKLLLERNLAVLGSMAAIGPLIGLLGTVWGIMRSFHDMAITGSAAPSVVAAGVAEALLTTAVGILVAVPSIVLYNHFNRRMSVMLTVTENHSRTLRAVFLEANKKRSGKGETLELHESILRDMSDFSLHPELARS